METPPPPSPSVKQINFQTFSSIYESKKVATVYKYHRAGEGTNAEGAIVAAQLV
jgi:hypothetical protein